MICHSVFSIRIDIFFLGCLIFLWIFYEKKSIKISWYFIEALLLQLFHLYQTGPGGQLEVKTRISQFGMETLYSHFPDLMQMKICFVTRYVKLYVIDLYIVIRSVLVLSLFHLNILFEMQLKALYGAIRLKLCYNLSLYIGSRKMCHFGTYCL